MLACIARSSALSITVDIRVLVLYKQIKKCLLNVYNISNSRRKKKLFFGDVDKQKTRKIFIYRSRPLLRSIRRGRISREEALDVRDRVENGVTKLTLKHAILILAAPNFYI